MVAGYDCAVSVRFGKKAEWVPSKMKFNDIYKGWDISISKQGAEARRKMPEKPTHTELAQWEKELRQMAFRLLDAVIYLMNTRTTRSEASSSGKVMVTGPGTISVTVEMPSPTYSVTAYGPPPTVSDIQELWGDLQRNLPYRKAVNHYLMALASTSESEVASELYKALETVEIQYGGEAGAYRNLGYPSNWWQRLKRNLNWGKRHVEEKFEPPSPRQRMSTNECLSAVREIIERFRRR